MIHRFLETKFVMSIHTHSNFFPKKLILTSKKVTGTFLKKSAKLFMKAELFKNPGHKRKTLIPFLACSC